ncbi:unnamed protein product [Angiostrongylus costaricensis]|uniref:U3 small nucleolar ribonucleoprotein protein MPP10 n=1 Tax=Angiostrongylus costaricensis TaxID=334426 RepID=A0A0R3PVI1_ANGCS|nr:unnamed protein product [Angiostrongylus costaricensis]
MEVDDPYCLLKDATDSQASQTSNTSTSSLAIQFSAEDLQENNANLYPLPTLEKVLDEGKTRRLNRRLALTNLLVPKLTQKLDDIIDLGTNEDETDDLKWLKKKFPSIKDGSTNSAVGSPSAAKVTLTTVATQRSLKQLLEKKLAERRKIGLEKRKQLYMKDNEDIFYGEQEQEIDEVEEHSESRHIKKYQGVGEESEHDENYNGDDEEEEEETSPSIGSESDGDEEEEVFETTTDVPETANISGPKSTATTNPKDIGMSLNVMVGGDGISESGSGMTQPMFPSSLSQWFGDKTEDESTEAGHSAVQTPGAFFSRSGSEEMESDPNLLNDESETKTPVLRRTLVDSDNEASDHSIEAELSDQKEEDNNEKETENGNDYVDDEADSDDELAVMRNLEKVNREKWFDDEASLSGDDAGSGLDDDDDLPNEYEAEEGDADDVPDSDVIRRQNHKLLLKQENDRDYKELIRLQDRLLADGDLGSLETNRTFRLKLREGMDVEDVVEEDAELLIKEKDEIISQASERRKDEYQAACEEKDEEESDVFDLAAQSVHISTHASADTLSKAPRTLLGQLSLGNAVKDTPGTTGVKQLYVSSSTIGVQKRPSSPKIALAKKRRENISVLSVLEQL